MAVVINDFEVVTESQPETRAGNAPTGENAAQPVAPTPHEVKRLVRQQLERLARLKAH